MTTPIIASAAMSSANYSVDSDVVGSFGGSSSSSNFQLQSNGGELSTDTSSSASYGVSAGFLQNDPVTISISVPPDVTMGAITGTGKSNLSTNAATWNIKTNNATGYSLTWQSSNADLTNENSDTISAYTPHFDGVRESWDVASNESAWGAKLASTSTTYGPIMWGLFDDYRSGLCAIDVDAIQPCASWINVSNTTPYTIISRSTPTSPSGDDETVIFGAEIGSSVIQPTGTYTVDVTMTATTL